MNKYYIDLHIHIGRTKTGQAVKITGARSLTFTNIIKHARESKGLDMIGMIDCHSPLVLKEMFELLDKGEMEEHERGGLIYKGLTIILGSELEIYDDHCHGPIHVLCYLPNIKKMERFSVWLTSRLKNIHLSSQRIYVTGKELQEKVKELDGLFIPAHVFTPFKSLYGKGVKQSLTEVFHPDLIDGIELGLSANTEMADKLEELHRYTYLSNSDAHSLGKIAREYQIMAMEEPSFENLQAVLRGLGEQSIVANYGLDPLLGKYHETVCEKCFFKWPKNVDKCPNCGHKKYVKGVAERINELASIVTKKRKRPPYIHQIPLQFIPGLGPKMLERLLDHFGTEMAILHEVPEEALMEVVPEKIAHLIISAREGTLSLQAGGGGKYGKILEGK